MAYVVFTDLVGSTELMASLGDAAPAEDLDQRLESYADRVVCMAQGGVTTGSVSHSLGLLAATTGRLADAEARFAAAAAVHPQPEAPTWLARSRAEWAAALLRRGDPTDVGLARRLLDQAPVTATDLGLPRPEQRVRELRAEAGQ